MCRPAGNTIPATGVGPWGAPSMLRVHQPPRALTFSFPVAVAVVAGAVAACAGCRGAVRGAAVAGVVDTTGAVAVSSGTGVGALAAATGPGSGDGKAGTGAATTAEGVGAGVAGPRVHQTMAPAARSAAADTPIQAPRARPYGLPAGIRVESPVVIDIERP